MPTSAEFDWVGSVFGRAACVTTIVGNDPQAVLRAFGADTSTLVDEDERYAFEGQYDAVVSAHATQGGIIAFEGNGFQGSLPEVLTRLAQGGKRVASMYWNEDDEMPTLTCADGSFVSSTSLFYLGADGPDRDDSLPPELDGLAEELRAADFSDDQVHQKMLAVGFAMMSQFCGVQVPRDIFDGELPPSHPIRG